MVGSDCGCALQELKNRYLQELSRAQEDTLGSQADVELLAQLKEHKAVLAKEVPSST